MNRFKLFASALFATGIALGGIIQCPANARDVDAISVKQKHLFFGKITVTATNDSLRIDDKTGLGFVLVTKAPDWTVYIFRDAEKSIYTESFAAFRNAGLVNEIVLPHNGPMFSGKAAGETQKDFGGFVITCLKFPAYFEFLPVPKNTDPKISEALCSALRTHPIVGLPLTQISLMRQDLVSGGVMKNKQQTDLSTLSIARVKVSSSIFDVPKNYAKAKSLQEVVSGPNSTAQNDDLQDMLGPDPQRIK